MTHYPAAALASCRNVIGNAIAEIQHLTTGDSPVGWDMARKFAADLMEACKVVQIELAHHAKSIADLSDLAVLTAEEEEAMDALEITCHGWQRGTETTSPTITPTGNDALRAIATENMEDIASADLDEAFDEIEAQAQRDAAERQMAEAERILNALVDPVFHVAINKMLRGA